MLGNAHDAVFCAFAVRNHTICQCKCCTGAEVPTKEVPTRTTLEPMQASWICRASSGVSNIFTLSRFMPGTFRPFALKYKLWLCFCRIIEPQNICDVLVHFNKKLILFTGSRNEKAHYHISLLSPNIYIDQYMQIYAAWKEDLVLFFLTITTLMMIKVNECFRCPGIH